MNSKYKNIIPIKVNDYSELFYEFDYNELENRTLRDDIDTFILEVFKDLKYHEDIQLLLEVNLPKSAYSINKEILSIKAIEKYYKSKIAFDNKMKKLRIMRIGSYIVTSILLFILWFFIQKNIGDSFLTVVLDTAATVVLWQVMSAIFIESKDYRLNSKVNKIIGKINVKFKYLNE